MDVIAAPEMPVPGERHIVPFVCSDCGETFGELDGGKRSRCHLPAVSAGGALQGTVREVVSVIDTWTH